MRFIANGPSIPNELLVARDEGRVVFFCGAGVSLARARLPDFYGLTTKVLDQLGADENNPARRLMSMAYEFQRRNFVPNAGALISADRIFGLLEQQFTIEDIRAEVARALRPAEDVDLSAHQALLDLSRGPDGAVRLVTTNFDRLFAAADPSIRIWEPPHLPDLRRQKTFDGIVHLHGITNKDYTGITGEEIRGFFCRLRARLLGGGVGSKLHAAVATEISTGFRRLRCR
jgi:hypothetical protein